jgi:MFS transporter, PAT family, beta-lactamase induction signal transducer AmpG
MADKRKFGWRDLQDSRVALMLALGFSSGLPFLLVFGTLSVRLREAGVPIATIGVLSWLGLAYSLKFLWSPLVDALDVPLLARAVGRRRAWMIACQLLVAAALVAVGFTDPATSVAATAAFTLVVAFGSATQDVVVDGWRIDAAPHDMQGIMAAAYQLGYRIALLAAGAGALYIAEFAGWRVSYFAMAALMAVGVVASVLSPIVDRAPGAVEAPRARFDFGAAVAAPLMDLYRRTGKTLFLILLVVAFYRLSDFLAGVMANPLYVDLGFSKAQIASVAKIYGFAIGIAGAFAGGWLVAAIGLYRTMIIGACLQSVSHLLFSWLATQGASVPALVFAISADNFTQTFAGTALIAYMSGLTAAGFSATQYALFSSLYALLGKLIAGLSGFFVEAHGYAAFFLMTAAVPLPVMALLWTARRAPAAGLVELPAEAKDAEAAEQVR